jgi:hypothetical protein
VAEAYDYVNYQRNSLPLLPFWTQPNGGVKDSMASSKRFTNNVTDEKKLWSRGMSESFVWQTSQISTPPGADWVGDTTYTSEWDGKEPRTRYYFEDNPGAGQYIYILEEGVDQKIAVRKCPTTARCQETMANVLWLTARRFQLRRDQNA